MALLAGIFLDDLQLDGLICFPEAAEKRRRGFAYLKIDGTIFDLNDDVVVELAVERMKNIVRGAGAIVFQVGPIEMIVVNEGAIEKHAPVWFERARDNVGGIGGSTSISGRTGAAFGIGFDDEAAEIRDQAIDLICFRAPKFLDLGIEWVK